MAGANTLGEGGTVPPPSPGEHRRLLCVYQHAPTPGAPGIYRHRQYFAELVRRGWQVDVVSTPRNYMSGELPGRYRRHLWSHETIDGIHHHWLWTPGGIHRSRVRRVANYGVFATAAALRALALPRPDVVYVSSPPLTVAPLGPVLGRRFSCPWVLEVRDIWPESAVAVGWLGGEGLVYRLLERLAHRVTSTASTVVVPTPGLEPLVREHGARRVVTLTGMVVARTFDTERRRSARARLEVGDGECLFLYLGAIGVANGLNLLVDAAKLASTDAPLRVVVAGDGSARGALEERVRSEQVDRITLLPPVARDEVDDLLAAADVGLHLLRPDPVFESALPTKVLEYLGAGLPFITTTRGLPAQLAEESGGSAAGNSARDLARELERWSSASPDARRKAGEQARAFGLERYGVEACVDRFQGLLDELLRERTRQ